MSISIQLYEWQVLRPSEVDDLAAVSFDGLPTTRAMAERLTAASMLGVYELRAGVEIRATSYVGRVRLGDLDITILPKVDFDILGSLFRYAYQLRNIRLVEATKHRTAPTTFQDLLIQQLISEVENLFTHGIQRQYRRSEEALAWPRGRIVLERIANHGGLITATLPCRFYPRSEDVVLNQTLLAGLRMVVGLTSDLSLRTYLRRLASMLELSVTAIPLSADWLRSTYRALDRLTRAYRPALQLIELLYFGTGLSWDEGSQLNVPLPGYLFDMNAFFETLVTRFLVENLSGYQVHTQYRLRNMMNYQPVYNPLHRHAPTPRPDIAVTLDGRLITLLDAKYRDLWEHSLPREMLYQLAMYALIQENQRSATILYPTTSAEAKLQVIAIKDPFRSSQTASVILRPVNLASLEAAIWKTGATAKRHRTQFAHRLVFGDEGTDLHIRSKSL
jgi:5-methylcytosine-specific restriction enzyme subunit McrC